MSDPAQLTLLLGPQTALSLGLNGIVRDQRWVLASAGLGAMPSRVASPLLRHCLNDRPAAERATEFSNETAKRPVFLSAVNFFGPPHAGMMKGEMFPNVEKSLAGLADIAPKARLIICIDTLPAFFLASRSQPLETRVSSAPWEALYELSWAELVRKFIAALPASELIVLTTSGAARKSRSTLHHLFGQAASALPDVHALLRAAISETGQAVLDRLISEGEPPEGTLAELYSSFALRPHLDEAQARLGIDKVTFELLELRFTEDLDAIHALPGVEVI